MGNLYQETLQSTFSFAKIKPANFLPHVLAVPCFTTLALLTGNFSSLVS